MKYIGLFILVLASWNSWGEEEEFTCPGGREFLEQLKWDVQNYQEYDREYQANTHLFLFYCQMTYEEDPKDAFPNLQEAARLGDIISNFRLAEYLLTGLEGRYKAVKDRDQAIKEFENTLEKINAIFTDYPNTRNMAVKEISAQIYPQTLRYLTRELANKYLEEGYEYYNKKSPAHYGDPTEAFQRNQAHKDILERLEGHITSCLADQWQHIQKRAKRWGHVKAVSDNLAAYKAFYLNTQIKHCPHYKKLLAEIRKREATMYAIALNCAPPSEQATEERPPCTDITIETEAFVRFVIEEWLPKTGERLEVDPEKLKGKHVSNAIP